MAIKKILTAILFTTLSTAAFASGGYGGGSGGFGRSAAPRVVDHVYEQGKAVFAGKNRTYGKIRYCVTAPGGDTGGKLDRKSLKAFKRRKAEDLAFSMYNCDAPDQKIVDVLAQEDLLAVVYYLNKRYRLGLQA